MCVKKVHRDLHLSVVPTVAATCRARAQLWGRRFFFSHKPWNQTFAWPCTDSSRPLVHSSVTPSVGKTKKVNVEKQCAAAAGAIQSGRRARVSVCITHCPSPSLSLMRHCKMKLTFCPIHTKRRASGWRASWSSHHCRRC